MADIAQVFFHLDLEDLDERELTSFARRVFTEFEVSASRRLPIRDYGLELVVEEGSVKGWGKVVATAAAIYLGVGQFGSFVQGVREIDRLGRSVADRVVEAAVRESGASERQLVRSRRTSGDAAKLSRLFREVRDGKRTPAEATEIALHILDGDEEELPQDAKRVIRDAFDSIVANPSQLDLALGDLPVEQVPGPHRAPPRRREPVVPVPTILRVEIHKDRRTGKLKVVTIRS